MHDLHPVSRFRHEIAAERVEHTRLRHGTHDDEILVHVGRLLEGVHEDRGDVVRGQRREPLLHLSCAFGVTVEPAQRELLRVHVPRCNFHDADRFTRELVTQHFRERMGTVLRDVVSAGAGVRREPRG